MSSVFSFFSQFTLGGCNRAWVPRRFSGFLTQKPRLFHSFLARAFSRTGFLISASVSLGTRFQGPIWRQPVKMDCRVLQLT